MKFRPWYRAWPETAVLLFGLGWIPLLPRRAVLALARLCGRAGYRFARELRTVGQANLDLVFGESLDPQEKERLLRASFGHFALLVLDIIWFSLRPRQRLARWFRWEDSSGVMFDSGAQLLLTAHYGNWENLGQAYAAKGQPVFSVAAPLKNRPADRVFCWLRQQTGQVIVSQQGAARQLLRGLREGKKLAVLLDQNTRPRDGGIFIDVMGLPAPVSAVPAALAVKTGAPVITLSATADPSGVYNVRVYEVLHPDPAAADPSADLTQRMSDSLARMIRADPQYWCWMYKRWRLIPEGAPAARFPFYARAVEPGDFRYGA